MARRNPPAKWVLPDVVDPDRLCIQIEVPNDPAHIAAFRGALLELASAYKWADDTAHTAKDVALVWRDIIDNMGGWGCSMLDDVRQNDTLPCVLEKHLSGEWQPFANLRYCPPNLRVHGGIIQYYDEGTSTWVDYPNDAGGQPGSQPGEQPGGDTPIPYTECKNISLTVYGNAVTMVPFRVRPGNTVTLSEWVGGWTNNYIQWLCPDGKIYALGACGLEDGPTLGAIIEDTPVGKLICQYGSHYFDPLAAPFTIPMDWSEEFLILRMNDPDLSDNAGSVTGEVQVCNDAGEWCVNIDFTDGLAHGFSALVDGSYTYAALGANGWYSVPTELDCIIIVSPEMPAGTYIKNVNIQIDRSMGGSRNWWYGHAYPPVDYTPFAVDGSATAKTWEPETNMTQFMAGIEASAAQVPYDGWLTGLTIRGVGAFPTVLGAPNCT